MNARRRRAGGEKVRTASLLQGSGLVRTVGPCAQRRVASGHSRVERTARSAERRRSGHRASRSEVCSLPVSSPVDWVFEQSENRQRRHCTLFCDELFYWAAAVGQQWGVWPAQQFHPRMRTVLRILFRFSLSINFTVNSSCMLARLSHWLWHQTYLLFYKTYYTRWYCTR